MNGRKGRKKEMSQFGEGEVTRRLSVPPLPLRWCPILLGAVHSPLLGVRGTIFEAMVWCPPRLLQCSWSPRRRQLGCGGGGEVLGGTSTWCLFGFVPSLRDSEGRRGGGVVVFGEGELGSCTRGQERRR